MLQVNCATVTTTTTLSAVFLLFVRNLVKCFLSGIVYEEPMHSCTVRTKAHCVYIVAAENSCSFL